MDYGVGLNDLKHFFAKLAVKWACIWAIILCASYHHYVQESMKDKVKLHSRDGLSEPRLLNM